MYKIPLPITVLELKSVPDETGFTMPEKIALGNAWALLSPDINKHAKEHFLNAVEHNSLSVYSFFTEHESMLDKFRDEIGQFKMRELHTHPYKMFETMEALKFDGLDTKPQMHAIISPIAGCHFHKNVKSHEIRIMSEALSEYLKQVLRKQLSPTLERSIDRLCDMIVLGHQ